jgi:hypothetical protein
VCYVSCVLFKNALQTTLTSNGAHPRTASAYLVSAILVLLGFAERVHARASDHVTLHYRSSGECPDVISSTLGAIDRQLGQSFQTTTQLVAEVDLIAHDADDFELVIDYSTSTDTSDHRVIHAESCSAAADAVALLVALALVPSQTPPEASKVEVAARPPSAAIAPLGSRNELGALVALDTAVMQRLAAGAGLELGINFGAWRVNLAAVQWIRQRVSRGSVQADIEYLSVALGACYLATFGPFEAGPCAHIEIGRLGGFASGAEAARADGARLQAAALGGQARLRLFSPVWIAVGASLEWLERRPRFVVDDVGLLHQPAEWGLRVVFGPLLVW